MATAPIASPGDDDESRLVKDIRRSKDSGNVVSTALKTDERVIARVTDGIYRQPGSALRELISNSYDADATRVIIKTDRPRFGRISIEDDGHGMTPEVLAHLLLHIGGSAKRSDAGKTLGVTASNDPTRSPNGRKLIGKIGIGLFSVSQLTYSFQIITKVKDDPFRTIATVALKQYADEAGGATPDNKDGEKFESGKVNIWREKAADGPAHGTTIILTNIRPQARDTLRSREIWSAIEQNESSEEPEARQSIEPPRFHIGRVDDSGELLKEHGGQVNAVPWDKDDDPETAFQELVDSVWNEVSENDPNPRLDRIFDYYLRMVWQISLAVPLPYVDGHLFDLPLEGWAKAFELSNQFVKSVAKQIEIEDGFTARKYLDLTDPAEPDGQFDVFFDNLKLKRPVKFRGLPSTGHALKQPLVFLGKCREEFKKVPRELSGGPLAFEAYLFWTPKVAPTEHQGSLIRIHGSSGTLFDSTFMRYQVAELSRLRQITCEIFVSEGLDSALNIDRESFNNAHPHSVYITRWLHNALRQLATAQKKAASEVREQARSESKGTTVSELQQVSSDVWVKEADDPASSPPDVQFSDSGKKSNASGDSYVFSRSIVASERSATKTSKSRTRETILEEKLKAIAQILAAFGLLDALPKRKQEKLLKAIFKILDTPEE